MIDRHRLQADLSSLVGFESVTGDEGPVQDRLHRMLEEIPGLEARRFDADLASLQADPRFPGMEVERDRLPLLVGRVDGAEPGPAVLLVAHVDVVPPGDPASWTSPAFAPEVRDGRMYGRGACDMKGGLVAALEAVRCFAAERDRRSGSVTLGLVPGEEDGGSGSFALIRAGYGGDVCVIPEPTDLDIVVAHGGAITFTLEVPGRAAHASMRREGVSALENLAYLNDALRQDEADRNAAETDPSMAAIGLPYPTIIGRVTGGNWASTLPDLMVADGRYGVTIHQDAAGAADELRAAVDAACRRHPFLSEHPARVRVWGGRFDSAAIPRDHPLSSGLAEAFREVTGAAPGVVGVPYGADMRLFVQEASIPTVMFGPGDVRVAHAADESVPLEDVATCAAVLDRWLGGEAA